MSAAVRGASGGQVRSGGRIDPKSPPSGCALEGDSVRVAQESVADGFGGSGFAEDLGPLLDGHLARDHDGAFHGAILDHIEEDVPLFSREDVCAEIVQDQQLGLP